MAYSDNYPNGYKSGYSSADDPDRIDYSPAGWDRERRERMAATSERERIMSAYEAGLAQEQFYRDRVRAERARQEWVAQQEENERRQRVEQKWEAIRIIVQQKRDEYNNKSWFGKAVAKLRGQTFYKMRDQITEEAERKVSRMTPQEIDAFIEREGRQR